MLRHDAMNFALLIVIQYLNTQQVEEAINYTRNLNNVQRMLRRLNHNSRLNQGLLNEFGAFQQMFEDIRDAQVDLQDITWRNEITVLLAQLPLLQQNFQELNTVTEELIAFIDNQHRDPNAGNAGYLQTLHDRLIQINRNTEPVVRVVMETVTAILIAIRQLIRDLNNNLPERLEGLTPAERQAIHNLRIVANFQELYDRSMQTVQTAQNALEINDLTEENRIAQTQLLRETRAQIEAATRNQLVLMRRYEQESRDTLEMNDAARECMNTDILLRRLSSMEYQYTQLFQQSQLITQQVQLTDANPQTHFPNITQTRFWTHLYRKVALDPNHLNAPIVSTRQYYFNTIKLTHLMLDFLTPYRSQFW